MKVFYFLKTSISQLVGVVRAVTAKLLATYTKVVLGVRYLKTKAQPYLDQL